MWLPKESPTGFSRTFKVHLLGDSVKGLEDRAVFIRKWEKEGGVLLIGYEMFRQLVQLEKRGRYDLNKSGLNGARMGLGEHSTEAHGVNEEARNRKAEIMKGEFERTSSKVKYRTLRSSRSPTEPRTGSCGMR